MRKLLTTLTTLTLLAAAPFASAAEKKSAAATPPPPTSEAAKPGEKKADKPARPLPFQGTVHRVDKTSNSFITKTKAGKEHVFHITAKTKILKDDAPATLDDITADEVVRGSRTKIGENEWEAVKVIIGAKAAAEKEEN